MHQHTYTCTYTCETNYVFTYASLGNPHKRVQPYKQIYTCTKWLVEMQTHEADGRSFYDRVFCETESFSCQTMTIQRLFFFRVITDAREWRYLKKLAGTQSGKLFYPNSVSCAWLYTRSENYTIFLLTEENQF